MVDKKYQFNPIKDYDLSKAKLLKMYQDMLKIRYFDIICFCDGLGSGTNLLISLKLYRSYFQK